MPARGQVVLAMSGEEAKLVDSMRRVLAEQGKLEGGLDKLSKKSKKAFGSEALSDIKNYATGLIGVSDIISGISSMMREVARSRKELADGLSAKEFNMAQLAQVASNESEYKKLIQTAKNLYGAGGAPTQGQAAQVVFDLKSANQLEHLPTFSKLASTGVIPDIGGLSKSTATMLSTFGQVETGNARAIISKAFAASEFSPSTVPELLEATARSGASAKALGLSDEAVLAATAMAANATGNADLGGTQVASFLKSIEQSGEFEGMSLRDIVTEIKSRKLSGAQLFKFLGRQEAVAGYRVIANDLDKFDQIYGSIEAAQKNDLVASKLTLPASDPSTRFARQKRIANAQERLSGEEQGQYSLRADAIESVSAEALRRKGRSELQIYATGVSDYVERLLFGDKSFVDSRKGQSAEDIIERRMDQIDNNLLEESKKQTRVLERIANQKPNPDAHVEP